MKLSQKQEVCCHAPIAPRKHPNDTRLDFSQHLMCFLADLLAQAALKTEGNPSEQALDNDRLPVKTLKTLFFKQINTWPGPIIQ